MQDLPENELHIEKLLKKRENAVQSPESNDNKWKGNCRGPPLGRDEEEQNKKQNPNIGEKEVQLQH